jgi:hypothetical protein
LKTVIAALIALMMGIQIGQANAADRLTAVEREYNAGILLADTSPAHARTYARTKQRALTLTLIRGTPGRDLCTYKVILDDKAYSGAILIHYDERNRVTRVQDFPNQYKGALDQAALGQGTDLLSTAGGLALGFAEGNPLFGPLMEHDPLLGLLALGGLKASMIFRADYSDYPECVAGRTTAARTGYAFGAHNVTGIGAVLLGAGQIAMPIGITFGLLAWIASRETATEDAIQKCLI